MDTSLGRRLGCAARTIGAFALTFLVLASLRADTKGKLTGRILDAKGEGVLGANVLLTGTTLGAAASGDGYYVIVNIPPGEYTVRMSGIGYQTDVFEKVRISAGQTTTLDATMEEEAIQSKEVVVVAQRPLVDTRQTSAVSILDRDDLNVLPVQTLDDVVALQAGVVDGHFRGGRIGEVQYQVDGVSVNNPYDNSSVVQLDKSVIQEVQVISGTFDAEYGQAMSGVVNAVLRSGSDDHYDFSLETYGGEYVLNPTGVSTFPHAAPKFPPTTQSLTLTLSGPSGLPRTSFLVNARRFVDNGYLYGERTFLPTDTSDFRTKIFRPTGDNAVVPMNTSEEWSGQFKLSTRTIPDVQLSYQAVGSIGTAQAYNFAYRYDPDGRTTQRRASLVHGIDWTHSLSSTTYYTLSLRQNYFLYTDYAFQTLTDPRYFAAGPPRSDPNYELGSTIQGYDLSRFKQETNALVLKGSVTSQIGQFHMVKAGFEAQTSAIVFGSPGTLATTDISGIPQIIPHIADTLYPGLLTYHPLSGAFYVQDRVEVSDFMVRFGVRVEGFDARATVPSDLENPANTIQGSPLSHPKRTTQKFDVAPRLGVSYPITATGSLYFSYGHFYQMPGLGILYSNSDYSVLKNLQAGGIDYGVMGNPDIKPEFTTQYEFGFKQQFGDDLGIDASLFYKDIRDLLGVEFVSTYAAAQYARFTNVDFGSVSGITLSWYQRLSPDMNLSLSYTYQNALGNSSDPRETAVRASAGEDPRPRLMPFDWNQTHTLNLSAIYSVPDDYAATLIARYGSGSPYTPSIGSGFGANLETNSADKPSWIVVDLRAEKYVTLEGVRLSIFLRAFNLFDTRYENGFVFATTGSPDYSLTPPADATTLIDPSRYAAPRRIEFGFGLSL